MKPVDGLPVVVRPDVPNDPQRPAERRTAMPEMTGDEATEFAARIAWAINKRDRITVFHSNTAADRNRVARDLAGYLRALDGLARHARETQSGWANACVVCDDEPWPCPDAFSHALNCGAFAEALIETGGLYGEKP